VIKNDAMTTSVFQPSALLTPTARKPSQTAMVDTSQPNASPTALLTRAESTVFPYAEPLNAERNPIAMLQFLKSAMVKATLAKRLNVEATPSVKISIFAKTTSANCKNVLTTATAMLLTARSAKTTNVKRSAASDTPLVMISNDVSNMSVSIENAPKMPTVPPTMASLSVTRSLENAKMSSALATPHAAISP